MKHVNGDMDDLFRRASERYPLRTDSADWNRLSNSLDNDTAPLADEVEEKRRRRGIFWWFLLVPLAGLGYLALEKTPHHDDHGGGAQSGMGKGSPVAVQSAGSQEQAGSAGASAPGATGASAQAGSPVQAGTAAGQPAGRVGQGSAAVQPAGGNGGATGQTAQGSVAATAQGSGTTTQSNGVTTTNTGVTAQGNGATAPSGGTVTQSVGRAGNVATVQGTVASGAGSGRRRKRAVDRVKGGMAGGVDGATGVAGAGAVGSATGNVVEGGGSVVGNSAVGSTAVAGGSGEHSLAFAAVDLNRAPIGGGYKVNVDVSAPVPAADSSDKASKKSTTKLKSRQSHGYIGVFGAPDLSTVKMQGTKGVGTTFGILLGYAFNDRWALETGVYLDEKKYYSSGEYFSKKGYTAYPGSTLEDVNGSCNMWEIPINLRYNFTTSPRMKFFATAGFSTYLMTKESYLGAYESNSTGYPWTESWQNHKPSQYWFSVVNISAGFEQRLGKIGNLRVEPYLRVPLSGIGVGNLPVMSVGLNIGFTRQIF